MYTQNAIQTWRILDINHQENMVVLVSSASPTIKRFGAPSPIANAKVVMAQALSLLPPCPAGTPTLTFGQWQVKRS